jgi:aquaporin Z
VNAERKYVILVYMNKLMIEFIGTFFLVFTIAFSGNPLAIGAVLIAMVYMGGYISGAHYNPAVTTAIYIRGKISSNNALKYIISQILGGTSASLIYYYSTNNSFMPQPGPNITLASVGILELLFTFALASVVLHTATSNNTKDNNYFGLAIGLTVMAGGFSLGDISGAVFNPAVILGAEIARSATGFTNSISELILYVTSATAGGILAGAIYNSINNK